MEIGLAELLLSLTNLVQLVALLFIQRRTNEVKAELARVLEWARTPGAPPSVS